MERVHQKRIVVCGLLWLVQEKADRQVQICGKNVPPHPCGELQLILHLPTRRLRERGEREKERGESSSLVTGE